MGKFKTEYKKQLSELLAAGHRKFGKVLPRRPYLEDEEGGGAGDASLVFEGHPLLDQQPQGAISELTFIIQDNKYSLDEAEKRAEEATPQLRKQLDLKLGKEKRYTPTAKPSPFGTEGG